METLKVFLVMAGIIAALWGIVYLLGREEKEDGTVSVEGWKFRETSGNTAEFMGTSSENKEVTIPEKMEFNRITAIGDRAFQGNWSQRVITVKSNITRIGTHAFWNCKYLEHLFLPDTIEKIGTGAFGVCPKLYVHISPENPTLAVLNGLLFFKPEKRLLLCMDRTNTVCSVPAGTRIIDEGVFAMCEKLSFVHINQTVLEIGAEAFNQCTNLTNVSIYEGLQSIGDYAFLGCEKLQEFVIPSSVVSIGKNPFRQCFNIQLQVAKDSPYFYMQDMALLDRREKRLISYIKTFGHSSCHIPEGTVLVDEWAFYGITYLQKVVFPTSVLTIGKYAFSDCKYLQFVELAKGLTRIGDGAFEGCQAMKTITIPEGVKEIGDWAFFNCESLHKVVLPASVVAIGNRAFDKCSPMLEIIVPRGSYAESYAKANQINCKYPDADDWLKE